MRTPNDFLWGVVRVGAITAVLAVCLLYVFTLHEHLENAEWEHVAGLTRILIPDTFMYAAIVEENDFTTSVLFSGIKNSIGPSAIWYLTGFNWYAVSFFNVAILYFVTVYIEKNCRFYGVADTAIRRSTLIFVATPAVAFYSVGALKELPMMLLILMALYYYNRKAWGWAVLAASMLVVFRYQMIIILFFMVILAGFKNKSLKYILTLLFAAAAAYPALEKLGVLEQGVTLFFRQEYGQQDGFGAVVEYIRSNVFVASAFAILIRAMQSFFEPFLAFLGKGTFLEEGSFSVMDFVQFFTLLMLMPIFWRFMTKFVLVLRHGRRVSKDVQMLFGLIVASLILVGGFSFIHHRYLYPFFPLLLIAALIPRHRLWAKNVSRGKNQPTLIESYA